MTLIFRWLLVGCFPVCLRAQEALNIKVTQIPGDQRVIVTAADEPFTEFIYPDSLEKPVLYPIRAPGGQLITRGFPLLPRAGEPRDHPHHIGLWLNYENVNGLDFWNNSFAIPADKKHLYGWIRTDSIFSLESGKTGRLGYRAHWEDWQKKNLLDEVSMYTFSANAERRIIDRTTTLTALEDISFPDAKDGMLGLRVARELQLPSTETRQFSDNKGNISKVTPQSDSMETGNYLTSRKKGGNEAWGTRAEWCLLYGKMQGDTISIAIIDHPGNPGYPTYWHARGYGLFAANPLGQKIFSNGKEELGFKLKKGESVVFRYRIVIASGKERLSSGVLDRLVSEFAATP
jgi:hypothetical protein